MEALARTALACNARVWTLTRGQQTLPEGVTRLTADRHDTNAFANNGDFVINALDNLSGSADLIGLRSRGDELARQVRGRSEQPPVVMITGFPPNPAPQEVARVMIKPFDLNSIRDVLSCFCCKQQVCA